MARRRFFLLNRVVLGLVAFFVVTGLWEFKWKPQYRDYYEAGIRLYHSGKYQEAQRVFDQAYEIAPNALDVILMEGWTNLKQNHLEEARFYFDRALKIDPRTEEAQMGSAFVALESGRGKLDSALLSRILSGRKNDPNVMILLAGAEEQQGEYFKASETYNRLVSDKDYGPASRLALQNIFGLSGFSDSPISGFPAYSRPPQLQTRYRASNGAFQQLTSSGAWSKIYLQGVDLGAAAPGYRPTQLPNDGAMYADWLNDAAQLNANTLRVYTLLPPSFYRAFQHHAASGGKLSLVQQVWVTEPDDQNLFQPEFMEQTRADIRYVVDAVHGRGEVPVKRTHGSGVYEFDLADRVSAYVIGSDLDQKVIDRTNVLNGHRSFDGKYLSVTNASATEAWLAQMADYLFDYEESTYNWQHPVAMLSGAAPDPSANALLENKVTVKPACLAGIFAAYSVSPFYPEYMERNPRYANARDKEGPNPLSAIVRDLRARLPVPLIVGEYGAATSMQPRRVLPSGWNQGGYSENRQADALARLTRSLRESGVAGALLFEMADEWYREGWLLEGNQVSGDKASLFLNDLDPAKRYGVIGYRTSKWNLFSGDPAAWEKEKKIEADAPAPHVGDGYDGERTVPALQMAADEGYLYLRLQVACLDCVGTNHTGKTYFSQAAYVIALNTVPGAAGINTLPFGGVKLAGGANFLLLLREPERSRMLIAESYNPFQSIPRPGDPKQRQIAYKPNFSPSIVENGSFQPAPEEVNPGQLVYGQGSPEARDYDSRAEWYADLKHSAILVRIPWGRLLVTDPADTLVFAAYSKTGGVRSVGTVGVQASAFVVRPRGAGDLKDMDVVAAIPATHPPQPFLWARWNSVKAEPYRKKAFAAVAQEFGKAARTTAQ